MKDLYKRSSACGAGGNTAWWKSDVAPMGGGSGGKVGIDHGKRSQIND